MVGSQQSVLETAFVSYSAVMIWLCIAKLAVLPHGAHVPCQDAMTESRDKDSRMQTHSTYNLYWITFVAFGSSTLAASGTLSRSSLRSSHTLDCAGL